jgi:hypothetical protein
VVPAEPLYTHGFQFDHNWEKTRKAIQVQYRKTNQWAVTWHNYPPDFVNILHAAADTLQATYWMYGKEVCPSTHRPHLHVVLVLAQPQTYTNVGRALKGAISRVDATCAKPYILEAQHLGALIKYSAKGGDFAEYARAHLGDSTDDEDADGAWEFNIRLTKPMVDQLRGAGDAPVAHGEVAQNPHVPATLDAHAYVDDLDNIEDAMAPVPPAPPVRVRGRTTSPAPSAGSVNSRRGDVVDDNHQGLFWKVTYTGNDVDTFQRALRAAFAGEWGIERVVMGAWMARQPGSDSRAPQAVAAIKLATGTRGRKPKIQNIFASATIAVTVERLQRSIEPVADDIRKNDLQHTSLPAALATETVARMPTVHEQILELIAQPDGFRRAVEKYPTEAMRYIGNWQRLAQYVRDAPAPMPRGTITGIWLWGIPGTGKTSTVTSAFPRNDVIGKSREDTWYQDPQGATVILLDDMKLESANKVEEPAKAMADGNPMPVNTKGGQIVICFHLAVITANMPISIAFGQGTTPDVVKAVERRYHEIEVTHFGALTEFDICRIRLNDPDQRATFNLPRDLDIFCPRDIAYRNHFTSAYLKSFAAEEDRTCKAICEAGLPALYERIRVAYAWLAENPPPARTADLAADQPQGGGRQRRRTE